MGSPPTGRKPPLPAPTARSRPEAERSLVPGYEVGRTRPTAVPALDRWPARGWKRLGRRRRRRAPLGRREERQPGRPPSKAVACPSNAPRRPPGRASRPARAPAAWRPPDASSGDAAADRCPSGRSRFRSPGPGMPCTAKAGSTPGTGRQSRREPSPGRNPGLGFPLAEGLPVYVGPRVDPGRGRRRVGGAWPTCRR